MHPTVHEAVATFPEWLTAIGGVGAFAATARLAFVAKRQMGAAQDQVGAARDQVEVMRQASEAEVVAVREQIAASIKQGEAIREAARAQLQPMVFAHADRIHSGPDTEYELAEGQFGFGYRLKNEGTGLALNIEHGVEIDGHEIPYEGGMRWRALRPDEAQPAFDFVEPMGSLVRVRPWIVVADERELPSEWSSRVYWARFDNVFGERWETRNPSGPTQAAEFKRIDDGGGRVPAP